MLPEHMGQYLLDAGEDDQAEIFIGRARELQKQARKFHDIAVSHERLSAENVNQQQSAD